MHAVGTGEYSVKRSLRYRPASTENFLDTLRIMVQPQDDITFDASSICLEKYDGPVEGLEFLLSQSLVEYEELYPDNEQYLFPPLAVALRLFSRSPRAEPLIRKLVHKGADVHAPVPRQLRAKNEHPYPWSLDTVGTPLDELFVDYESSFQSRESADEWLRILASEGYDVLAYLEKERALHVERMQLTFRVEDFNHNACPNPRQLVFDFGSRPSVSWDWWIDPDSPAYLLREVLKQMNVYTDERYVYADSALGRSPWEMLWPIIWPDWDLTHEPKYQTPEHNAWQCKWYHAQERAERRLRKRAAKMERFHGLKRKSRMPGTWPD